MNTNGLAENLKIQEYTKKDTVLNTPGQFIFQLLEDYEIKIGKNHQISKKRIEEIIEGIRSVFKKIGENITSYYGISDQSYYGIIIKKLNSFVNSKTLRFPGLQVINLGKDQIEIFSKISERILICEKSDGVRYLLIHFSNGVIFFVGRNLEFFSVCTDSLPTEGKKNDWSIENFLDGELILDKTNLKKGNVVKVEDSNYHVNFLVFDAIVVRGENIGHLKFRDRLKSLSNFFFLKDAKWKFLGKYKPSIETSIFNILKRSSNSNNKKEQSEIKFEIEIFMKDYFTFDKIETLYNNVSKKLSHENDGIIINLDDYPYYSGQSAEIYKWKPANLNTIDFEVTKMSLGGKGLFILNVSESRDKIAPVSALFIDSLNDKEAYTSFVEELESLNISGKPLIAECFYDSNLDSLELSNFHNLCESGIIKKSDSKETLVNLRDYNHNYNKDRTHKAIGGWRFLRFRKDKLLPNSIYTYQSVWRTIIENVQMSLIMERIKANLNKRVYLDTSILLSTYIKTSLKKEQVEEEIVINQEEVLKKIQIKNTKELSGKKRTREEGIAYKDQKAKEKKENTQQKQAQTLQLAFGNSVGIKMTENLSKKNEKNSLIEPSEEESLSLGDSLSE